MWIILIGLWISVPALFGDDVAKPRGPEDLVGAVVKEFEAAVGEYREAESKAKTQDERKEVLGRFNERKNDLARRAMRLAQDRPKDAVAVEALTWIVRVRTTPLTAAALQILHRDHLDNEAILPACWYSTDSPSATECRTHTPASARAPSHEPKNFFA